MNIFKIMYMYLYETNAYFDHENEHLNLKFIKYTFTYIDDVFQGQALS